MAVTEEKVKEEVKKTIEAKGCPFLTSCKEKVTQDKFQKFCNHPTNYKHCWIFTSKAEKREPINWLFGATKNKWNIPNWLQYVFLWLQLFTSFTLPFIASLAPAFFFPVFLLWFAFFMAFFTTWLISTIKRRQP